MSDGASPLDDASDPAGSGRAHGAGEPRPRFLTAMERVCAHNFEQLRRWAVAHPEPSDRPQPDLPGALAPEPDPPAQPKQAARRATPTAPAHHTGRVLRWLPASLQRLYRRLAEARPYARKTRPRPLPPDDERPSSGQARHYRLEIAYDKFCEHRPPPKKLFRTNPWRRDLTSWCDAPNSWTGRRKPRCHHCERAHAHYVAARNGDWKAEVALYKLARRGAVRLLAERREYRESRRQFWARHREEVARRGPEPMPPQFEPELWPMIAHRGSVESWHHRDRREVERDLVRAHARHVRRLTQRRRERKRDLAAGEPVGRDSAQRASRQTDVDDATSAPPPQPRHCEDPGAAGVRGNPGPPDKRVRRGPQSSRRQPATRNDGVSAAGLSAPPADVAPPDAPATTQTTEGDKPAPARVSMRPPKPDGIKIGAARPCIPPPAKRRPPLPARSVPHEHRQIGVVQHELGDPAQDEFAQRTVRVGAHDQQIAGQLVRRVEQGLAERPDADRQHVQLGADGVLRQNRRHLDMVGMSPNAHQHMHPLGGGEAAQGRNDRPDRRPLVSPGDGDAAAERSGCAGRHHQDRPVGGEQRGPERVPP